MFILLDIDGVMVTTPPWRKVELMPDGFSAFNVNAVKNLNAILEETNAGIIITSSHKSRFTIKEWIILLKNRGIDTNKVETLIPNISHLNRSEEITLWLNSGNDRKTFVIIDDDKSLNDLPGNLKCKWVMTELLIGLDENGTKRAIEILKTRGQ